VKRQLVDTTDSLWLSLAHSPALLQYQDLANCTCTCRYARNEAPILALLREEPKAAQNLEDWGLRFPLERAVSRCAPVEVVVAMVICDTKKAVQELNHYHFFSMQDNNFNNKEISLKRIALIETAIRDLIAIRTKYPDKYPQLLASA
jgi:hypothetical protein